MSRPPVSIHLATINGITATAVACLNCGMAHSAIAARIAAKYDLGEAQALALVRAIAGLEV